MRALLPERADDVDVHAFYAIDWVERGGVRVNFVSSADGAAQADGKSEGLQTEGDNRVFKALRDLADVVLAGAGTVTIEGYGAVKFPEQRKAIRREYGLRPTLPIAVVSRSLRLNPESALFTAAPPEARTIVLTCASSSAERRAALARVADVVVCGDDMVDLAQAREELEQRGLTRILSEGGPTAFSWMLVAGVVDELCLSVTPRLVGPGPTRIVDDGPVWPPPVPLRLAGLLEEDGALFLRYRTA
ncbi:MAG TPA: pyrimidine reductase family protein [Jatrophihabitans sp.]|nr:pyrimidine reductase family protein [Jatrophihabitans sp.]